MKSLVLNIGLSILVITLTTACNNSGTKQNATERTTTKVDSSQQTNPEIAAVYSCPMHPEVTSNEPGKCSKCGMNLEKVAAKDHEHAASEKH